MYKTDTLKKHLPFSGQEGLQEVKKIAVRFEEKIYTAATNQSDYLRKISLKILTMETKSQNTIPTGNANEPLDPGALCAMSASYGIRNATATGTIATTHAFVMTSCSPVYCTNISPSIMVQVSNALWVALCATDATYGIAPLDSTAETGHGNGADWQEEIYQKIKVMKETYLPEINEMYQRIDAKLQQHDSHPQQPKPEQLDKLKVFKAMLERLITFLQDLYSRIL
ncbi:hypothetical protein OIU77_027888 [Salix suchowensis]|uniref:Mediator complex subunit 15 KIX domain-containing protein n=1 Tax=Salix suchowensis TaxID=1278906 RepID=A0ABQ9BR82_9ROSI|nr:hypothetical protein OIU77_027888 [Salix suchowensis]